MEGEMDDKRKPGEAGSGGKDGGDDWGGLSEVDEEEEEGEAAAEGRTKDAGAVGTAGTKNPHDNFCCVHFEIGCTYCASGQNPIFPHPPTGGRKGHAKGKKRKKGRRR
uniref:Uncharacterized protein n=1 Tax=Trieres chinensis TaxID=1514140 RepID=A0A6U1WNQ3_TRICV|mmetsp:Transcript_30659/g.62621  ORF Transcript_30659/g.62621 Transcript_30659/m.62621 type:complete len:108 (+) Transcript_30659:2-325(+)